MLSPSGILGGMEEEGRRGGRVEGKAMQQKWIATEEGLTSGEQIVPNHAWSKEGVRATFNCRLQNFFLK